MFQHYPLRDVFGLESLYGAVGLGAVAGERVPYHHAVFRHTLAVPAWDRALVTPQTEDPGSHQDVRVELENLDSWKKFQKLGTEMIITKSGRRLFPSPKVRVSGLNRKSRYLVGMSVVRVDTRRYKFTNSSWLDNGEGERFDPALEPRTVFYHPDGLLTGEQVMAKTFNFVKVKLTNNTNIRCQDDHVFHLHSGHKYQLRFHVALPPPIGAAYFFMPVPVKVVTFPETEFIAVTAYQNERVTKLKIEMNPFAKGFRENGGGRKRKRNEDGNTDDDEEGGKRVKADTDDSEEENEDIEVVDDVEESRTADKADLAASDSGVECCATPLSDVSLGGPEDSDCPQACPASRDGREPPSPASPGGDSDVADSGDEASQTEPAVALSDAEVVAAGTEAVDHGTAAPTEMSPETSLMLDPKRETSATEGDAESAAEFCQESPERRVEAVASPSPCPPDSRASPSPRPCANALPTPPASPCPRSLAADAAPKDAAPSIPVPDPVPQDYSSSLHMRIPHLAPQAPGGVKPPSLWSPVSTLSSRPFGQGAQPLGLSVASSPGSDDSALHSPGYPDSSSPPQPHVWRPPYPGAYVSPLHAFPQYWARGLMLPGVPPAHLPPSSGYSAYGGSPQVMMDPRGDPAHAGELYSMWAPPVLRPVPVRPSQSSGPELLPRAEQAPAPYVAPLLPSLPLSQEMLRSMLLYQSRLEAMGMAPRHQERPYLHYGGLDVSRGPSASPEERERAGSSHSSAGSRSLSSEERGAAWVSPPSPQTAASGPGPRASPEKRFPGHGGARREDTVQLADSGLGRRLLS